MNTDPVTTARKLRNFEHPAGSAGLSLHPRTASERPQSFGGSLPRIVRRMLSLTTLHPRCSSSNLLILLRLRKREVPRSPELLPLLPRG